MTCNLCGKEMLDIDHWDTRYTTYGCVKPTCANLMVHVHQEVGSRVEKSVKPEVVVKLRLVVKEEM